MLSNNQIWSLNWAWLWICGSLLPTISTAFVVPPARVAGHAAAAANNYNQPILTSPSTTALFWGTNTPPEPLASEGDWTAYLDEETTGLVYYFNGRTGESLWEPPTKSFPVIVLPRVQRRKAERKRSEYIRSLELPKIEQEEFPSTESARNEEEALQQRQEKQQKKQQQDDGSDNKWFDFLFEDEPEPEPNWFESVSSVFKGDAAADTKQSTSSDETTTKSKPSVFFLDDSSADKGDDSSSSGTAVVEQEEAPAVEAEDQTVAAAEERKPGFFERLAAMQQPTTTEEPEVEEAVEETTTTPSIGFFDRLRAVSTPSSTAEPATDVAEPAVQVEPEPAVIQVEEVPVVEVETPIKIEAASCVLPHPAKMFWGGEDAVFTAGRTFGVFDGVTGASKLDGVPLYSKTLASEMRKASKGSDVEASGMTVPILVQTLSDAKDVADATSTGASTAVVASITEDGFLRALNLGDSGCLVIRNGRVAARTKEISHYFDCPYQLSTDSPDKPRDGVKMNIELVRGDLIVMASDGVFDNLADTDIVDLVVTSQEKAPNGRLSALAKKISDRSRKVSLNRKAETPYAKQAKRNGDPDFEDGVGGKVDDVSCVVVRYA